MKKLVVSLLALMFMALAATGTVSAQCAAKPATSYSAATTCAQCTSCKTATCCSCVCPPVKCVCPTVVCCVVVQCCKVKCCEMPHWKPCKPMPKWGWVMVKPVVVKSQQWGGVVQSTPVTDHLVGSKPVGSQPVSVTKSVAVASASTGGAANVGSGVASVSTQTIAQTQAVGSIIGNDNTITFASQTAGNTNVAASHANVNVASAFSSGSSTSTVTQAVSQTRTGDPPATNSTA